MIVKNCIVDVESFEKKYERIKKRRRSKVS